MRATLRRPSVLLAAGLLTAGLVGTPTSAVADEPSVTTDGDAVVYADPTLQDEPTTTVEGVLREVVVEDHAVDGSSDDHGVGPGHDDPSYVLVSDGGVVPVALQESVGVSDVPVTAELVEGPALDSALDGRVAAPVLVASARVEPTSRAAAAQTSHRAYVAVVSNSGGLSATDSEVGQRVDTGLGWWRDEGGASVASYARAGSVQRYSSSLSSTNRCFGNVGALWNEAAQRFPGVDFRADGNHLVVVVGASCDGTGVGTVGGGMASGGQVVLTESTAVFTSTLVHELGHNHGLQHANHDSAGEYWDLYSPMGLAVSGSGTTALGTPQREQLGLTDGDEVAVVATGQRGTYRLTARSGTSGLRGVRVVSGGTTYWAELRDGSGRDSGAYYPREARGYYVSSTHKYPSGVTITSRATSSTGATVLRTATSGSQRLGARSSGKEFTASGGVSVTVDSVDATGATVTVLNGAVAATEPVASSVPTVGGSPQVGSTATALPGTWTTGTAFTYQWLVDGAAVSGATGSTFVPRAADVGRPLTVRVTGSRTGYLPATRDSEPVDVLGGTLASSTPTMSGSVRVGSTVTAKPGTWTSGTTFAYQWLVDGVEVAGATAATRRPTAAERGKKLSVRVTGTKAGYAATTRTSSVATVAAGTLSTATPTISGTRKVGRTLTAKPGSWTSGTTFSYRWYANGKAISGATRSTYKPTKAVKGKTLTVKVTGTKTGYATASRTSKKTGRIA